MIANLLSFHRGHLALSPGRWMKVALENVARGRQLPPSPKGCSTSGGRRCACEAGARRGSGARSDRDERITCINVAAFWAWHCWIQDNRTRRPSRSVCC